MSLGELIPDMFRQDAAWKMLAATVGFACSSLQPQKKQAEQLCFGVFSKKNAMGLAFTKIWQRMIGKQEPVLTWHQGGYTPGNPQKEMLFSNHHFSGATVC